MIANWVGINQTLILHGLTHTLLICFITITLWVMDGINFKLTCLNFCYINYWWVWLKYCPLFAPRYTSFILNHIMRLRAPWDLMYHELSLGDSMQALLVTPQGALDCAAISFYEELQMIQRCVRFKWNWNFQLPQKFKGKCVGWGRIAEAMLICPTCGQPAGPAALVATACCPASLDGASAADGKPPTSRTLTTL